ncbi:MAG: hypothetical protein NDI63_10350 [Pseudobdellovibrio sp.]|nr:hypothetical protein [Pseudobdellovibrio sp.]
MKQLIVLILGFVTFLGEVSASTAAACTDMSDEKLLELLTDTENRLNCKASLSIGAACAGIVGTSGAAAVLAKQIVEKRQAVQFSKLLNDLAGKSTDIEALKYQQRQIAASGDLSLATNSSGDAKIKLKITAIEEQIENLTKNLQTQFDDYSKNANFVKNISSENNKNLLALLEKNVASVQRFNPAGAKNYHKLVDQLVKTIESKALMAATSSSSAATAKSGALKTAAALSKKVLGSRLYQFLSGATFSGATLFFYSSNAACSSDTRLKYVTYDDDCQPVVEVSQNVIDFLTADPATQLSHLRQNKKACDFYLSLATKIKAEDSASESAIKKVQNLSCGDSINFQIVQDRSVTNLSLKFDAEVAKTLRDEDKNERLNFGSNGVVTQFCENNRCNYLQKGASLQAAEKILSRLQNVKYAASEAFKCCSDKAYNCPIQDSIAAGRESGSRPVKKENIAK